MKKSLLLGLLILCLISCKENTKNSRENSDNNRETDTDRKFIPEHDANPALSTAEIIAIKNGLDKWNEVNEIRFTFNVDRDSSHYERSWIWNPKTDDVTMLSSDTIAYNRKKMDSTHVRADQGFINDKYWLLAPFNLVWDEGVTFSEKENQIAPISKERMDMITITYGDKGGYTPGDAYDLYYGKDFMIKEWVFREGNTEVKDMITTWEDYEEHNGIMIATTHKDSTGGFNLNFTNISVK